MDLLKVLITLLFTVEARCHNDITYHKAISRPPRFRPLNKFAYVIALTMLEFLNVSTQKKTAYQVNPK